MTTDIQVEVLEFHLLGDETTPAWQPVGWANMRVRHRLSEHLMKWVYTRLDANEDLSPNPEKFDPFQEYLDDYTERALSFIEELPDYNLVGGSFEFDYVNVGWNRFCVIPWNWAGDCSDNLQSQLDGLSPDEVREFASKQCSEFYDYLHDAYFELKIVEQPFSLSWYLLRAATLYYRYANVNLPDDVEAVDAAFTVGSLLGEAAWKFQYEKLAMLGLDGTEALSKARRQKAEMRGKTAALKEMKILELWRAVRAQNGLEAVRFDSNAALHIVEMVKRERVLELTVKSSGKPISHETIRRKLAELRAEGKLA